MTQPELDPDLVSPFGIRKRRQLQQRRKGQFWLFFSIAGLSLSYFAWQTGRHWETEMEKRVFGEIDKAGFKARLARSRQRIAMYRSAFVEPLHELLLPPKTDHPMEPKLTLLVELEDLLTHSYWDRESGYKTVLRPGWKYFLGYLNRMYEVVIFTSQSSYNAAPILQQIGVVDEPNVPHNIRYFLYREACHWVEGKSVKDLSYLGRDLKSVVALDTNKQNFVLQPDNALIIKPWKGEKDDRGLIAVLPLLEAIAAHGMQAQSQGKELDVRPILASYKDKDPAKEYLKLEQEQKAQLLSVQMPDIPKNPFKAFVTQDPGSKEPLTLVERFRRQAQAEYKYVLRQLSTPAVQEESQMLAKINQEFQEAAKPKHYIDYMTMFWHRINNTLPEHIQQLQAKHAEQIKEFRLAQEMKS